MGWNVSLARLRTGASLGFDCGVSPTSTIQHSNRMPKHAHTTSSDSSNAGQRLTPHDHIETLRFD